MKKEAKYKKTVPLVYAFAIKLCIHQWISEVQPEHTT